MVTITKRDKMTKLAVICGWCNKDLGEKDGQGTTGVSHGICEVCASMEWLKYLAEIRDLAQACLIVTIEEDGPIADRMRSYWQNLNSGSCTRY